MVGGCPVSCRIPYTSPVAARYKRVTYIMFELGPYTTSGEIPHESFTIRTSTNEHHAFTSALSTEDIDKDQRLDTLALCVTCKATDDISIGEVDRLDQPVARSARCNLAIGRNGQRRDSVCVRVEFWVVGGGENGRFEQWLR